jgi:FkbM family methyltransferase
MLSKIRSAAAKIKSILFEEYGWPAVKNEKISKRIIKKYLPEAPIAIDCGAFDGADSLQLARILHAKVYSFEAVPAIFAQLQKNVAGNTSIVCTPLALSNTTGKQIFYVSEGSSTASSSLLHPKEHLADHPETYFKKKIEVDAVTLDEWAQQNNIAAIDLLWLDMQGFELKMLKASPRILKTVSVIHTEVSTKETYEGVEVYNEYKSFLEENGFTAVIEAIPAGWDMGNVLFVRKR